ncbi:hypothetical protein [Haloglomus salinum]|uniref:hypothetical protein n=1 Tax=Haloglomus salinum TaxID=2962673 RepID=UPI0020C97366|nr:hypothetical protein [Haloglomus salinum]
MTENKHECPIPGCDYESDSSHGLQVHKGKVHEPEEDPTARPIDGHPGRYDKNPRTTTIGIHDTSISGWSYDELHVQIRYETARRNMVEGIRLENQAPDSNVSPSAVLIPDSLTEDVLRSIANAEAEVGLE